MANRHWKLTEDKSHKERVAMRQMLRDAGVIPINSPNEIADQWLTSHGYLNHKGHKAPEDRVERLRKRLGRKLRK